MQKKSHNENYELFLHEVSTVDDERVLPEDSTCSHMCKYMIKRYQHDQDDTRLKDPNHV